MSSEVSVCIALVGVLFTIGVLRISARCCIICRAPRQSRVQIKVQYQNPATTG